MKLYSLVGNDLVECHQDEINDCSVGILVDKNDEIIRLIIKPGTKKQQRELLMEKATDFNKKEFAGTFLVSYLENPSIIDLFLKEVSSSGSDKKRETKDRKKAKKKRKKKKDPEELEVEQDDKLLQRWDPELVKKLVNFLYGKDFVPLSQIEETLEVSEGEAYWLTQDLIYTGIVPGRWTGYSDGRWIYQVHDEPPLSMAASSQKPSLEKKPTPAKKSTSMKKDKETVKKKQVTKKDKSEAKEELKVPYKNRTYTFDSDITEEELKSKRGIPRDVKKEVAKKLGYDLYKNS
ncbi:MAG: hypothetical protein GF308_20985 [Candidatus Heimdallarchaeota archaeon]|nr:hypothetical protein [Candidatus Heimdallarchaeota archaeon]